MADISKVKLPSGNVYEIKDAVARQMIAGGITYIIAWDGTSTPDVTKIPAGVVVKYNDTNYTGTLSTANGNVRAFYLVKSSTQVGDLDVYDEYVIANFEGSETKFWEKLGDTRLDLSDLGALAYKDNVTLTKGSGDVVLGEATTFTNSTSAVTFSGGSTDSVLGANTTFAVTQPTITVTPAQTYLGATASGTAVGANGTASAVTGYANPTTDTVLGTSATFSTTVTPTTTNIQATASGGGAAWNSKDSKTVLTGVKVTTQPTVSLTSSDSSSGSSVTYLQGASVSRTTDAAVGADGTDTFVKSYPGTTKKLETTSVPNVTGNTDVTIPNVTSAGTASTWAFAMGSGNDAETLIISGANSTAATLGTALSASKVTLGTAKTVATGSLVTSDTNGGSVMTGLGTATTASALTGVKVTTQPVVTLSETTKYLTTGITNVAVGANGTASVIGASSTFTNTQPTIALATGATAGAGVISVATGITSASTSVDDADSVTALTGLGTPSTSTVLTGVKVTTQPTITLAENNSSATGRVQVATGITSATATGAAVSANDNDSVTAVTGIGTGTAAAQTITVGTTDKIKIAKYDDLSVTVS